MIAWLLFWIAKNVVYNILWVLLFKILNEINYVDWRGKDGEMIFDDPGAGNYSCALMAGVVPEAPEPEPPPPPKVDDVEKKKEKVTRAEKRAEKAKAKKKK